MSLRILAFAGLIGCAGVFGALGDTPLRDPSIPNGEVAVYRMEEGDRKSRFTEKVRVESENGHGVYGFVYESEQETIEVKIQKEIMVPYSVFTVSENESMRMESSTRVSFHTVVESKDIIVLSFSDLKYTLRGFPFGEDAPDLGISFLNTNGGEDDGGPSFDIKVIYVETEEIVLEDNRTVDCHKLELKFRATGIMRVLNTFVGKTYFWYSVEAPHYLVAYEGNSSFPGSPRTQITIENYSGW